jgi:hypothetical protein
LFIAIPDQRGLGAVLYGPIRKKTMKRAGKTKPKRITRSVRKSTQER